MTLDSGSRGCRFGSRFRQQSLSSPLSFVKGWWCWARPLYCSWLSSGKVTRISYWVNSQWRQLSTQNTKLFGWAAIIQQPVHTLTGIKTGVCVLAFLSSNPKIQSSSVGWEASVCNHLPIITHTVIHTNAVLFATPVAALHLRGFQ